MEKLRTFLETIKKMPQRSGVLCAAVVIPSEISEVPLAEIEKLLNDGGFEYMRFRSRQELENALTQANSLEKREGNAPVICLITQDEFRNESFSGIVDLVFDFSE